MYKCVCCGKNVKVDIATVKKIICPSCGYRILEKEREKTPKRVSSM